MHTPTLLRRASVPVLLVSICLISLGIASPAGARSTNGREPSSTPVQPSAIVPLSASTCSSSVCIYVTGTGLVVANWSTTAVLAKSTCSTADFLVNGSVRATAEACGSANEKLDADWAAPGTFPNGTILCNTWSGISGEPCATVHS
jgi:hypothetical protein